MFQLDSNKKPTFFFIIGRARSGTTLLRTMFDAHEQVAIPLESPLILRLAGKYAKKTNGDKELILEFYRDVLKVKDFKKWQFDEEELKEKLLKQAGHTSFKELINIIYLSYTSLFAKKTITHIGDKNPVYSVSIPYLMKLYPEAKYIHLKRDHRAHIYSMLKNNLYANDVVSLAYRWRFSAKRIAKIKRKLPDRFYSIRYEDLVEAPHQEMEKICNWLNLSFDPGMVEYSDKIKNQLKELEAMLEEHHRRVLKPIDTTRTNAWEQELSPEKIAVADYVVGAWAEHEGYRRKNYTLNLKEKMLIQVKIAYQRLFYIYRKIYFLLPLKR